MINFKKQIVMRELNEAYIVLWMLMSMSAFLYFFAKGLQIYMRLK